MITTLKELKREFPERITTSGNTYYIDGQGWYRQSKDAFGLWTWRKTSEGSWTSTSFEKLVEHMYQLYR